MRPSLQGSSLVVLVGVGLLRRFGGLVVFLSFGLCGAVSKERCGGGFAPSTQGFDAHGV